VRIVDDLDSHSLTRSLACLPATKKKDFVISLSFSLEREDFLLAGIRIPVELARKEEMRQFVVDNNTIMYGCWF
jgi:hypothetical protein